MGFFERKLDYEHYRAMLRVLVKLDVITHNDLMMFAHMKFPLHGILRAQPLIIDELDTTVENK